MLMHAIVAALRAWRSHAYFAEQALLFLLYWAHDSASVLSLQASNCADIVLDTLECHPGHTKIQERGAGVVMSLAEDAKTGALISSLGGVERLFTPCRTTSPVNLCGSLARERC